MRWRERRQRLDQTSLCARSEVRVHVRALLGSMPELRLHGIDGVPAGDRLAGNRVATKGMVLKLGAYIDAHTEQLYGPLACWANETGALSGSSDAEEGT